MTRIQSVTEAVRELNAALLVLKEHHKVTWTDKSFRALYYLARLARRAQYDKKRAR